jgi:hypothetical protein
VLARAITVPVFAAAAGTRSAATCGRGLKMLVADFIMKTLRTLREERLQKGLSYG